METLRIHYRRDKDFTYGFDNCAWCTTPDGKLWDFPRKPYRNFPRGGQISGVGDRGHGGRIYTLIVALADAGYTGYPFEAHDGRIMALTGVIDKKAVPVGYGGEKVKENPPPRRAEV